VWSVDARSWLALTRRLGKAQANSNIKKERE
jgi:hypothetical protein